MIKNNYYFVIEGLNGCGKTTQLGTLARLNPKWYTIEEPSEHVKAMIHNGDYLTELGRELIITADRADIYAGLATLDSRVILSSRSYISGIAYATIPTEDIVAMTNIVKPQVDGAILLHMDEQLLSERLASRAETNVMERLPISRHMHIQASMRDVIREDGLPYIEISASLDAIAIATIIESFVVSLSTKNH